MCSQFGLIFSTDPCNRHGGLELTSAGLIWWIEHTYHQLAYVILYVAATFLNDETIRCKDSTFIILLQKHCSYQSYHKDLDLWENWFVESSELNNCLKQQIVIIC